MIVCTMAGSLHAPCCSNRLLTCLFSLFITLIYSLISEQLPPLAPSSSGPYWMGCLYLEVCYKGNAMGKYLRLVAAIRWPIMGDGRLWEVTTYGRWPLMGGGRILLVSWLNHHTFPILAPPTVGSVYPAERITIKPGSDVTFECYFNASPTPVTTWRRRNSKLFINNSVLFDYLLLFILKISCSLRTMFRFLPFSSAIPVCMHHNT